MTTETQQKLNAKDYRLLSDLADGRVPISESSDNSRRILYPDTPVILDQIIIDLAALERHCRHMAECTNLRHSVYDRKISFFIKENALTLDPKTVGLGCLTRNDLIQAAQDISEPASRWRKIIHPFGFKLEGTANIRGHTIGAVSKKYMEIGGRFYPAQVAVFDFDDDAIKANQNLIFVEKIASMREFYEHAKRIQTGVQYNSLASLCNALNLEQKSGNTRTYHTVCTRVPTVDERKRILNPIIHQKGYGNDGSVIGQVALRPVLSNEEVVTPDVIEKHIGTWRI